MLWVMGRISKSDYKFHVGDVNHRALRGYVPQAYPGRVTHFRPCKEYVRYDGPQLGWDGLAAGGVDTHEVPVYPGGMLVEPFVRVLAEQLRACLDEAEQMI